MRAWTLLIVAMALAACGGEGTADESTLDAGLTDAGAEADAGPACASEVPCVSDLQCVSVPGSVCNNGLTPARCQRLGCAPEGSPCGREEPGTFSPGGTGDDALCAEGLCRHPGAGPFVCQVRALSAAECEASCARWWALEGCSGSPDACPRLCTLAREPCAPRGGISDLRASSSCGAGGTAVCSDGELFSF
jgi:hypothetical protein